AFEGYDTVAVLADVLRSHGVDRTRTAESWPRVSVEGTRGQIQFSRTPGISVWQWAGTPIQVVDRDPAEPERFRILHAGGERTEVRLRKKAMMHSVSLSGVKRTSFREKRTSRNVR